MVFDMDGTLVDSEYDWPAIRRQLAVTGPSIIDELNALPEPERAAKWQSLNQMERLATGRATAMAGASEILLLLGQHQIATALVTNNSDENTSYLLQRFGFTFDQVITRDSGLFKPSGAPIAAAIRDLGVTPQQCMAVGDSVYDLRAAKAAGCACICVLDKTGRLASDADLWFPDLSGLLSYLRKLL